MAQRSAVVASKVGLHARPAAIFVKAVNASGVSVSIAKAGGDPVDAASILGVMTLGAAHGDELTLTAEGESAEQVLDDLAALLAQDLDA